VNSGLSLAIVLGMTVNDVSGKAIANLGWKEINLTGPVFPGDTLYAESELLEKRESKSRPTQGIVTVRTSAYKQDGSPVMNFIRSALVPKRGMRPTTFGGRRGIPRAIGEATEGMTRTVRQFSLQLAEGKNIVRTTLKPTPDVLTSRKNQMSPSAVAVRRYANYVNGQERSGQDGAEFPSINPTPVPVGTLRRLEPARWRPSRTASSSPAWIRSSSRPEPQS
jgi:hypothetical protein